MHTRRATKPHVTSLFLLALATLLSFSIEARAQFDTATVLGTVRDVNEAVAAGATVTLTNVETGIASTTTADEGGDYQFTGVKIGVYKVAGTREGFSTTVVDGVRVVVNARQRVDLVLQPGAVAEEVLITGATELLESESSVRGQVINRSRSLICPSTAAATPTSRFWFQASASRI